MPTEIYERIYQVVARIPRGRVASYGQIARHLGMPGGARTVGWAMRHCPEGLPWHRVINSRGQVSARASAEGTPIQRILLEQEGVDFDLKGCIDLATHGWDEI